MKKALALLIVAIIVCQGFAVLAPTARAQTFTSSAPKVVCVPFHGTLPGVPHDTWIGKEITLKGTAHDPDGDGTLEAYKWDFGDGYSTDWIAGVNPYIIEVKHIYTGIMADGTPYEVGKYFTAWLYVRDVDGNVGQDSYFIAIKDKTLDVEVNVAIDEGLWWLHKQAYRYSSGGLDYARWSSYSSYYVSATAEAVLAFEIHGRQPIGNPDEDPYVETVQRGLNYVFSQTRVVDISAWGPGTGSPYGNPDTNGNGIGIGIASGQEVYELGIAMMAITASGDPYLTANTGPTGVVGRTYKDILTDMVDLCAWGQNDYGSARGGWRYGWNYGSSDNSVSQWPMMALEAAETDWGIKAPSFVKTELDTYWLTYSQNTDGSFGYSGPGASNIARTGTGIIGLNYVGLAADNPRIAKAVNWLGTYWGEFGNYYGMYAVMKAMRTAHPEIKMVGTHDWYAEYARYLVDNQQADGGWPDYYGRVLASSWAILIMTPTVTKPGPVADAGPDVDNFPPTIPLKFDASGSHHMDPAKRIVLYEWDFESDGTWDYSGTNAKVEHVYPAYYISTLPSTIRVKRLALDRIDVVDFKLYVMRVLPHEWIAGWPLESLKAGAVAVKSYAWYWIDQGGRHPDADVCDGPHCQRYVEETYPKTDDAVEAIWHIGIRKDGKVFESQYWDGLAVVDYTGGKGLSIRSSPEIRDDNIVTVVPEGAMLAIVTNKPVSAYGFQWWEVVTDSGEGQRGWAAGEFLRSRWPTYAGETLNEYAVTYNLAVRMSQYGSMYLANQGWNFREILSYYYPSIEFFEDPIDWDKTAKDYIATLRVTDNSDPPLQDTDTCMIRITGPPWKPVADPNGPYEGYPGVPVRLDGSKSFDPESKMYPPDHPWYETIAQYEWDLDNDGQFDDSTEINPSWTWERPGTYSVGLKVTDSQPSGPGGTIGPLDYHIWYTTVVITREWAFAIITDLHIGRGYPDYGGKGCDDSGTAGQNYYLTDRLEGTVKWLNENHDDENIKFLIVLGDIADSGEYSELEKAKSILDGLSIPYFPVIGNHDVWSKTDDSKEKPSGDLYFNTIFDETFFNKQFEGLGVVWWSKSEHTNYPYLQNYAFSYQGITFVSLDFVNRNPSPLGMFNAKAILHYESEELLEYWLSRGEPTIIFSHHPMIENIGMAFDDITPIGDIIDKAEDDFGTKVLANFAGHIHGYYDPSKIFSTHSFDNKKDLLNFFKDPTKVISSPIFVDANNNYKEEGFITPANIPVVTTEAMMVASNEPTPKGIIRIVKLKGEEIDFNTIDGEFRALNPYFKEVDTEWPPLGKITVEFEVYAFTKRFTEERPGTYILDFGDGAPAEHKESKRWDEAIEFKHNYQGGKYYDVTLTVIGWTPEGEKITETITRTIDVPSPRFGFIAHSPVDVAVTDPDGLTVSKQLNEIPGAIYTEEIDFDGDGDPDDIILIQDRKIGDYFISVIPEPDAIPTDTYTLLVWSETEDEPFVLAENVQISNIPTQPYIVRSTDTEVIPIIPATVDFDPDVLNLKSIGQWVTVYIELPMGHGYDVSMIDLASIKLNGQIPAQTKPIEIGDYDGDGIPDLMVKFSRKAVQKILQVGDRVEITISGKLIDGRLFEGKDIIRVILPP